MVILGFTEEVTICSLCGKSELKGTFAVELNGETIYLGSSCIKKKCQLEGDDFTEQVKRDIKIAKNKVSKKYNQLAYLRDSRTIELLELDKQVSIQKRKDIEIKLIKIREEYIR